MQLLVLLREAAHNDQAQDQDARLHRLLDWLDEHFAEEVCVGSAGRSLLFVAAHPASPDEAADRQHAAALSQPAAFIAASAAPVAPQRRCASRISPIRAGLVTVITSPPCSAGNLAARRAWRASRWGNRRADMPLFRQKSANNFRLFKAEVSVWQAN